MSASNLTIFERNVCHGLDDDDAEALFLELSPRVEAAAAERAACAWRDTRTLIVSLFPAHMARFPAGLRSPEETLAELLAFARGRMPHVASLLTEPPALRNQRAA